MDKRENGEAHMTSPTGPLVHSPTVICTSISRLWEVSFMLIIGRRKPPIGQPEFAEWDP